MDTERVPEQSHERGIRPIRALATMVQQRLHLLTQSDDTHTDAANATNTRMRPLALTRAISFLRGLRQWLPVSWHPNASTARNALLSHNAPQYEFRRKRVAPKKGAPHFNSPHLEQEDSEEEHAPHLSEETFDENFYTESGVAADENELQIFSDSLTPAIHQLETISHSLDLAVPRIENETAHDKDFSDVIAFAETEFGGDLAEEYTRQLGLVALTPIIAPHVNRAQHDAHAARQESRTESLPVTNLDFESQITSFVPTLAQDAFAAAQAEAETPREYSEPERVLRVPQTRSRERAPSPTNPAISHSARESLPTQSEHTDSNFVENENGAPVLEPRHEFINTEYETRAPANNVFESIHQLFAERMNLSASLVAPDAVTLAEEITNQYIPIAQQDALAQVSLPRMFEELVSQSNFETLDSESAIREASPAPAHSNLAHPQLELRTAQPQHVLPRTVHRVPEASPVEPVHNASDVHETHSVTDPEHAEINHTLPIETTGALAFHADAAFADARFVEPRAEITRHPASDANFAFSPPSFRLSDEIRTRAASFPIASFATQHADVANIVEHPAIQETSSTRLSNHLTRETVARNPSERAIHLSNSITQVAPSFDFISALASFGGELSHALLPRQNGFERASQDHAETRMPLLAHENLGAHVIAHSPVADVDEHDLHFEHDAAPSFAFATQARADNSTLALHEDTTFASRALFQTIAQPLQTLALHEKPLNETDASVSLQPFEFASALTSASRQSIQSPITERAANPVSRNAPTISSYFPAAPHMDLRYMANPSGAAVTAAHDEPEPSPTAWHGSLTGSLFPELSNNREHEYSSHAQTEYSPAQNSSRDRFLDATPASQPAAPAPIDMNKLAQQVYALLKTQLRTERERHQLYRR